ncbi:MAG: DNA polymerase III subunit alpha [Alphaproteobacteria bacterium]|nr:DNA polymerase III subunit alpha [Alphaproteobacteria bacterium]MCY4319901.1 DNA polymerase III subunit alpha [Alphaproteobacteria bacterium]
MPHADFVHLRVHSAYSLSEGAVQIDDLVSLCRQSRMPAVAVTDTGNLFGAMEFAVYAARAGVQPVIGTLLTVGNTPRQRRRHEEEPAPILLLVQNEIGYRNLLRLVSASFLETPGTEAPHVPWSRLKDYSDGLIALSGGPHGPVGRALVEGRTELARQLLERLKELFPGHLYVEVMRHGSGGGSAEEAALIDLAYEIDLPLVATNDVHFGSADDYEAHDALLCIASSRRVEEEDRPRLTPDHRFKTAEEMRTLFADLPEALDNTLIIAQRCAFMPTESEPILPAFDTGTDEAEELRRLAREGLETRLTEYVFPGSVGEDGATAYRERLEYELDVIVDMKFPGYFLIVSEFIRWAKDQGIPVGPGRGSGAGSVVAWALQITDLDPLRWGLLFERFLNPERVSMPDFDIDFCQDRRDEVIAHVQQRYGEDRVAQIITFGKLQARAALRDVGRVLNMPFSQVDRISKLVPYNPANPPRLEDAVANEPTLQTLRDEDETVEQLIHLALKLEGLYRHASTHAAGVVIADRPLQHIAPLYRDRGSSDIPAVQFSMKWAEAAGLVKFDFLGLKTLTILEDTRKMLAARGIDIDLLKLPLEDEKTFRMLSRGDTVGVFQMEGAGMRDTLKKLKPTRFEDLIAVVALYRPGPMENIPTYIKRKHGSEHIDYMHESLQPILEETYGIIIYQEQVMQIAQVLSGYTLGGADLLRRAMGKKIQSEMDAQRQTFIDGAVSRGVERKLAEKIFNLVDKFAGYGFNKSHAAAYALIAYQTAWLKANYPVEFMAASMTHEFGNTDKLALLLRELDRMGVALLPPDVQRSGALFQVETTPEGTAAIRYALAAIKSVGRAAMEAVESERGAGGPFESPFDFAARLGPRALNSRLLERLAEAGAFDTLEPDRARIFAGVEILIRHAAVEEEERTTNQTNLFEAADNLAPSPELPNVPGWEPMERLQHEFDATGFYLSAHPLDDYESYFRRLRIDPIRAIPSLVKRGRNAVNIAGILLSRQERISKHGNRFAFISVSDSSGQSEITLFSEVLASARTLLDTGKLLLLACEAAPDGEGVRLTARSVELLDTAVGKTGSGVSIFIDNHEALPHIRSVLQREPTGRGEVRILFDMDRTHEVQMSLGSRFTVTPGMLAELKAMQNIEEVQEI